MKKIKLKNCSVCLKSFENKDFTKKIEEFGFIGSKKLNLIKKESRFDGRLGIIPISLHKKCYNKLMKFDELILEDYNAKWIYF